MLVYKMDLTREQLIGLFFAVETPDITILDRPVQLHHATKRGSRRKSEIDTSTMDDETFKKHFRMTKNAFNVLLNELRNCPSAPSLLPESDVYGVSDQVLSPEERVLLALWYLATPDTYRSIAKSFDVTESTVHDCVTNVCRLILELEDRYVKWPSEEEQAIEMATFHARSGMPGVIGALDGTHVMIAKPSDNSETYFNRKKFYSMNVMLLCDSNERFLFYSVGSPGSFHDARVLRRSRLEQLIDNLPADRHVLGDSAYPLKLGLMKPYQETSDMPYRKRNYNFKQSSVRMVIENAIGRLKGKLRRLKDIQCRSIERIKLIIRSCIILHNFMLAHDSDCFREPANNFSNIPGYDDSFEKRDAIARSLF